MKKREEDIVCNHNHDDHGDEFEGGNGDEFMPSVAPDGDGVIASGGPIFGVNVGGDGVISSGGGMFGAKAGGDGVIASGGGMFGNFGPDGDVKTSGNPISPGGKLPSK